MRGVLEPRLIEQCKVHAVARVTDAG